jgi:hypothetical protein
MKSVAWLGVMFDCKVVCESVCPGGTWWSGGVLERSLRSAKTQNDSYKNVYHTPIRTTLKHMMSRITGFFGLFHRPVF